jgi:hypothetical protein
MEFSFVIAPHAVVRQRMCRAHDTEAPEGL